jgi:hypothetical protein
MNGNSIFGIIVAIIYCSIGIHLIFFSQGIREGLIPMSLFGAFILIYGLFRGYRVIKKIFYE